MFPYRKNLPATSPEDPKLEEPKYDFIKAKDDLIELLTIADFESENADNIMGRLLNSKEGKTLIYFVGNDPRFRNLNKEIQGRIRPLVLFIKNVLVQPSPDEYQIYLELSQNVVDKCYQYIEDTKEGIIS